MAEIYVDSIKIDVPIERQIIMNMSLIVKPNEEEQTDFALLPTKKKLRGLRIHWWQWKKWYYVKTTWGQRAILKNLGWNQEEIDREMDLRERQKKTEKTKETKETSRGEK